MLKIAICGLRGHYDRFMELVNQSNLAKVVLLHDEDLELAKRESQKACCEAAGSIAEVFENETIDGVIILTENQFHPDLIIAAAQSGKHVFVEKPLCISDEDAEKIKQAVQAGNVKFFMSDPQVMGGVMTLKKMMDEHVLGDIVGVDPMSNSSVGIEAAAEMVRIKNAVCQSARTRCEIKLAE